MKIQQIQNYNTNFQGKKIKNVLNKNKAHNSDPIKEICDYSEYYANLSPVKKCFEDLRHIKEDLDWNEIRDMMHTPFGLGALLFIVTPIALASAFIVKGCSKMENNNKEQIENRQKHEIQIEEQLQNTLILEIKNKQ